MEHLLVFRRRQMREMDVEYASLQEHNEKLKKKVVDLTVRLKQSQRNHVDAENRFEKIAHENSTLRLEKNQLASNLDELKVQNSYLSNLVDEFQAKTPMVVVRNKEPEIVSWTIDNAASRFRENPRPSCLFSPHLRSKLVNGVELEFFPNGRHDAPRGNCTLMVRLEHGTLVTLQLFVGSKRTNTIDVHFTGKEQGFVEHFSDPRSEIDSKTDTLTVGIMVLKNNSSAKYIIY